MTRTHTCTEAIGRGRLRKANQFIDVASAARESVHDEASVGDAVVTLLVHAGVAAADAICCFELGEHARGDNHNEAVRVVRRVRPDGPQLAKALDTLLGAKTRAGYGYEPVTKEVRTRCWRATDLLVRAARDRLSAQRPAPARPRT